MLYTKNEQEEKDRCEDDFDDDDEVEDVILTFASIATN